MNPEDADWAYQPGKGGMSVEAKLGMFIVVILVGAFGFLVYHRLDLRHHRQDLAEEPADDNLTVDDPFADAVPVRLTGETLTASTESDRQPLHDESADAFDEFRMQLDEPPDQVGAVRTANPSTRSTVAFDFEEPGISRPANNDDRFTAAPDASDPFAGSVAAVPPRQPDDFDDRPVPAIGGDAFPEFDAPYADDLSMRRAGVASEQVATLEIAEETPAADPFDNSAPLPYSDEPAGFGDDEIPLLADSDGARESSPNLPDIDFAGDLAAAESGAGQVRTHDDPPFDSAEFTDTDDASSGESSAEFRTNPIPGRSGSEIEFRQEFAEAAPRAADHAQLESPAEFPLAGGLELPVESESEVTDDESFPTVQANDSPLAAVPAMTKEDNSQTEPTPLIVMEEGGPGHEPGSPAASDMDEGPRFVFDLDFPDGLTDRDSSDPRSSSPANPFSSQSDSSGDTQVTENSAPEGFVVPRRELTARQLTETHPVEEDANFRLEEFAYRNPVVAASAEEAQDVYRVQPGDNYWKISRKAYGTPRYFAALALYNQKRIADPKTLRPGMQVLIPSPEVLEKKYPGLFRDQQPRDQLPAGYFVQSDGSAAYRVGEQDTLSEIAQKHLGRSSRWVQIYQMNRNVLKNPNRLKPGTVLVLPDDATDLHLVP